MIYHIIYTLWLFNIAMENGPCINDFPIKTSIYKKLSMGMLKKNGWYYKCQILISDQILGVMGHMGHGKIHLVAPPTEFQTERDVFFVSRWELQRRILVKMLVYARRNHQKRSERCYPMPSSGSSRNCPEYRFFNATSSALGFLHPWTAPQVQTRKSSGHDFPKLINIGDV